MNKIQKPTMQEFANNSYLAGGNAGYLEDLYEQFLQDPNSVDAKWQTYFAGIGGSGDISHAAIREQFKDLAAKPTAVAAISSKQANVDALINAYRCYGHIAAKTNPLSLEPNADVRLTLANHQLTDADRNEQFLTRGVLQAATSSLDEIGRAHV